LAPNALHFHCARGLATRVLAHVSDSLVRVSRRVGCARSVSRRPARAIQPSSPKPRTTVSDAPAERELTRADKVHRPKGRLSRRRDAGRKRVSSRRFQALFNSLFKVLCIFPSRYLFAIGLSPVFSFRWNLPPNSSCNPKQPDSARAHRATANRHGTGFSPSPIPRSKGFERRTRPMAPF
jgi:hypothetical protein